MLGIDKAPCKQSTKKGQNHEADVGSVANAVVGGNVDILPKRNLGERSTYSYAKLPNKAHTKDPMTAPRLNIIQNAAIYFPLEASLG